MSINFNNFNPNKYRSQASGYSGMISGINGSLSAALSELNSISSVLSYGKGSNDLLTPHVLSSTAEVKSEISEIQGDLGLYTSAISAKAKELDDQALAEYKAYLRRMEEQRRKKAANTTNIEMTQ